MPRFLRHSLPVQALASVFAIAILCFMSALASGVLAWVSEADGQAINTAGSIRMATYRINFQIATDFMTENPANLNIAADYEDLLTNRSDNGIITAERLNGANQSEANKISALIKDMENRLASLRTYQLAYANEHQVINEQFKLIESQWFNTLKPILLSANKEEFYSVSAEYIKTVDGFVSELQYRNEQRQTWQQFLQMVFLVIIIIIMVIGMHKLRQNVLFPVQRLIRATSRFKKGEQNTRVSISGYTEFKKLGDSFNEMASTLETYQQSLENEVKTKTQHLIKANQVLELFYDFSKCMSTSSVSLYSLDDLITNFGNVFPHLDFTLCIQNDVLNDKHSIALHDDKIKELCTKLNCDNCLIKADSYTKTYPLVHQNVEFGELKVRPKSMLFMADKEPSKYSSNRIQTLEIDSTYLDTENSELIVALTNLISTALSLRKQRQQEHQLILLEERSTIARELHDSLAQSLSYLKIQVSVLQKRLEKLSETPNEANIEQSITQIKAGLNSAYQSLRDLLVTFRLTLDSDNFDEALHKAANEFAAKGKFEININNRVMTLNLSANEQVDLIQIAREALSNISRHAQADKVEVELGYNQDRYIVMTIIDNGIGISGTVDQSQHHGLMIMKERAHSLGGELIIANNEPTGTCLTVKFIPDFFNGSVAERAVNNVDRAPS